MVVYLFQILNIPGIIAFLLNQNGLLRKDIKYYDPLVLKPNYKIIIV